MSKFIRFPSYLAISYWLLAIGFSSCSTFDPPVTVPIYGHIDSVHFTTSYYGSGSTPAQGSASANIKYAWVYLDDNPIGAFQLPCTFPMVGSSGTHTVQIYSGIIPADGTSPTSIEPYYQYYSITLNMNQGSKYTFHPTSTYYSWVKFPYLEDFESEPPGNQPAYIVKAEGTQAVMIVTRNPAYVFEGKGSGMAIVNAANPKFIAETIADTLPKTGAVPVFLEINYKATTDFEVGMFHYTDSTTGLSPIFPIASTKWNKIYVNLSTIIAANQIGPYHIYFAMNLNTAEGHTADTLLLDNIKIVD
jgi:hypothetical protein